MVVALGRRPYQPFTAMFRLSAIATESIGVVSSRSVLIFVEDRLRALREFYRVLKPGRWTALFETVNWKEQ